ncbi:protein LBH-like isoform X3 [Hemiscyllium ocellatum]|nr:protein LBH-like isoform X3 [Hemiscyllium ocellatum]XP_060712174.1 protein LBH-like isoform X3 [Hemiscyllium ocellatum]XP_060712176.1 protein LBH-like isoform X3 [Hemiscyllium ocellatum]
MENVSLKEKVEHLPVQIFPDPLESADEGCRRIKGRLPSITVELTDASEVESGELRWPPPEASAKPDAPGETQPGPSEAAPAGEDPTAEAAPLSLCRLLPARCQERTRRSRRRRRRREVGEPRP